MRILALLFVFISINCHASAGKTTLEIKDKRFESALRFNVTLPNSYHQDSEKRYILMFDFHPFADTYLSGLHQWMSHNGEWPWLETIIVTPEMGNPVGKLFDTSGKSTPLLDFFETQMLPAIDEQFRTNGFRIMSGFRYNGSVTLSTLLNKPELFNAYIAISPELKNDMAGILSSAQQKSKAQNDTPRFLLLAHAESIKEEHQLHEYQQLNAILLAEKPRNLEYHFKNFNEHYHMSLSPLSTIFGIEKLFDDIHRGLPAHSAISQQGVAAIEQHYSWLSEEKYGFEVSPKRSIRNLGEYLLENTPEKGIKIFRTLVERFPEDAYSYHYLAQAYTQTGDFERAVDTQKKAVALSEQLATWHFKRMKRFLTEYRAAHQELNKQ